MKKVLIVALMATLALPVSAIADKKIFKKFVFVEGKVTFYTDKTYISFRKGKLISSGEWELLDNKTVICPKGYKQDHCRKYYRL
ncbi:hypothetical protein [Allomesorhizobium camelthorni]|uniref:Uncharacterized protein n=1 Tax=Allomesorhizobium camelthorni TaxID=475069 RepID=A0A6G4WHB3_9HYPH|nr:hypothetical protein [Mesorhizobium camelthorni]NGO53487.1 hypothetical protein [Mesorhizobium camelthorni]